LRRFVVAAAIVVAGCSSTSSSDNADASGGDDGVDASHDGAPTDNGPPVDAQSLFTGTASFKDVAHDAGLPDHGGTCLVFDDFDGDAHPDVFVTSFFGDPDAIALYLNDGKGHFAAKPLAPIAFGGKAPAPGWCAAGDVDGDGKLDVVLAGFDTFELHVLHNLGAGAFADVQTVVGDAAGAVGFSAVAMADFDADGRLDVMVAPYGLAPPLDLPLCHLVDDGYACVAPGDRCLPPPLLFKNSGLPAAPFLPSISLGNVGDCGPANTNAFAIADWNHDGKPDVFSANDWGANRLWISGKGTFDEIFGTLGGKPYNSGMGAAFEDFDLDGHLDLYVADIGSDQFYAGNSSGSLTESASTFGIAAPTRFHSGWAPLADDFDDDGFLDVFVASAAFVESLDELASVGGRGGQLQKRQQWDLLLHSESGHHFTALGVPQTTDAPPTPQFGATAVADWDGDGMLDVLEAVGYPMRLELLHNEGTAQHWIDVRLAGKAPNVDGIGATVSITVAGAARSRYVTRSRGSNGSSWATQHFGLGAGTAIDRVDVTWPSGTKQTITAPKADAVLIVTEP
jgi:hypothetical protein